MKNNKKTLIIRLALLVSTLVSLFFVPWVLVKAWILPLPNTVQAQVNEAINYGFEGIIVYVDEAGQPPAFYSAGWNDRFNKIPADPASLFKIGSISKLYVAVAISKLVAEKSLSLDSTLAQHFPEYIGRIEHADKITVKSLVQHQSGIPNLTNYQNFWTNPPKRKDAINLVLDLPANFEPNKGYEYSNTNFLLLADLIEKIVGYSHHEYIQEHILTPLAFNNTYASARDVNPDDLMSGYYVGFEEDMKTNDYGLNGYGSMVASAEDVGGFIRALNEGSVFESEEQQRIYSTLYQFDHGGLLPGYQSLAEYHQDIDTVVVQFINTTNFSGYEWNLSEILINRIVEIVKQKD